MSTSFLSQLPRPDNFVLIMLGAVILAAIYPPLGSSGGPLHLETVTTVGVSLVFLLSGAGLSTDRLRAGAYNWRLHLMIQLSTFVMFPIIGLGLTFVSKSVVPDDLRIGIFFLCTLPSTISTSIAMTSLARGNVAGAIFNATLSSLLGMVVTPLLMSLWINSGGQGKSLIDQLISIGEQLLLPFIAGQLLRPMIGDWISRNKEITNKIDRGVIVLIVYNSFCNSSEEGLWHNYGWQVLAQTFVVTGLLLFCVLNLTRFIARRIGFNVEDEIAAVFCGSKKSLAAGIPIAKLMFAGGPSLGLIVLPIMFYHQLQLLVGSVMAKRYSEREDVAVTAAASGNA